MCYREGRGIVPPPEFVPVGVLILRKLRDENPLRSGTSLES